MINFMEWFIGVLVGVIIYFGLAVPIVLHMKKKKKKQLEDSDNNSSEN